jgi:hypothetical protein
VTVASLTWLVYDIALTADAEVRITYTGIVNTKPDYHRYRSTYYESMYITILTLKGPWCLRQIGRLKWNVYKILYLILRVYALVTLRQVQRYIVHGTNNSSCLYSLYAVCA